MRCDKDGVNYCTMSRNQHIPQCAPLAAKKNTSPAVVDAAVLPRHRSVFSFNSRPRSEAAAAQTAGLETMTQFSSNLRVFVSVLNLCKKDNKPALDIALFTSFLHGRFSVAILGQAPAAMEVVVRRSLVGRAVFAFNRAS